MYQPRVKNNARLSRPSAMNSMKPLMKEWLPNRALNLRYRHKDWNNDRHMNRSLND